MSEAYGGKKEESKEKAQKKQTAIRSLSFFHSNKKNLLITDKNCSTKAEKRKQTRNSMLCSVQERS